MKFWLRMKKGLGGCRPFFLLAIAEGIELLISPLEGEMAGRPEGVVSHQAPTSFVVAKGASAPRAATPSVAFGDISPSRA
ncbi:hypothetical protein X767_26745 [Mesorhizobium sp. LSJC264A00]|nr:hypothetical protein X767_26745 [Mesorhizobium sp. LSJC264A00]